MAGLTLDGAIRLMTDAGCTRLLVKVLSANDNSKNQIYLGSSFRTLHLLPGRGIVQAPGNRKWKQALDLAWIDSAGRTEVAPGSQLVLYPQFPEVRFSGFLRGCKTAPSDLLRGRTEGRVLLLGIHPSMGILAHTLMIGARAAEQVGRLGGGPTGVLVDVPLAQATPGGSARAKLLQRLGVIHRKQWIPAWRLTSSGTPTPCLGTNCGGYTLEAELGVRPNGYPEPDFLGWEVKQHAVTNFASISVGALTLMTPEPRAGVYANAGPEVFLRKYGYPDERNHGRINFSSPHYINRKSSRTGLILTLRGYERSKRRMEPLGAIELVDDKGNVAAGWPLASIIDHWTRKHTQAVYAPSRHRKDPVSEYQYGPTVRLGEGTEPTRLLDALLDGCVYYDPGLKLEHANTRTPRLKRRNQFRIGSGKLARLYRRFDEVSV